MSSVGPAPVRDTLHAHGRLFLFVERTAWLPDCLVSFCPPPPHVRASDGYCHFLQRQIQLCFYPMVSWICLLMLVWSSRPLSQGLTMDGAHTSGLTGLPTASSSGSLW